MLIPVFVEGDFKNKESVKDYFGFWICEGMYVNEVNCVPSLQRQGWITEVIDEGNGIGKIKVQVVRNAGEFLDEQSFFVTEFEQGSGWCKALVD
ncbi:MAG: hypothetical protein HFJ28_02590 [Clostridia bacterium]|jgi:hypothetical protein|nr:hypothetical protein [Clostridia bacterium]